MSLLTASGVKNVGISQSAIGGADRDTIESDRPQSTVDKFFGSGSVIIAGAENELPLSMTRYDSASPLHKPSIVCFIL